MFNIQNEKLNEFIYLSIMHMEFDKNQSAETGLTRNENYVYQKIKKQILESSDFLTSIKITDFKRHPKDTLSYSVLIKKIVKKGYLKQHYNTNNGQRLLTINITEYKSND